MAVTEEELRIIISARERGIKQLALVTAALTALYMAARRVARVMKEFAAEAIEAVGAYEAMGKSAQSLLAAQERMIDSTLSQEDAMKRVGAATNELLDWMVELGLQSTLTAEGIRNLWRKMIIADMPSEFAQQVTEATADVIAAFGLTNREQKQLVKAFGDMAAKGYLAGEEMRQLSNAGFGYAQVARIMAMETKDVAGAIKDKSIIARDFFTNLLVWSEQYEGVSKRMVTSWAYLGQTLQELKDIGLVKVFGQWNAETGEMTGILGKLQPVMSALITELTSPEFLTALERFGEMLGITFADNIDDLAAALPIVVGALTELIPVLVQVTTPGVKEGWETIASAILVIGTVAEFAAAMRDLTNAILDIGPGTSQAWSDIAKAFQTIVDWSRPLDDLLEQFAKHIQNITRGVEILTRKWNEWKAAWGGGKTAAAIGPGVSAFQRGGMMTRAGLALVGERGPELLHLPAGARVSSTKETERILEQGPNVTFAAGSIMISAGAGRGVTHQVELGMLAALRAAGMSI